MLLHQIIGNRIEVEHGIADCLLIADPQHPQVHLLGHVRGVGLAADTPPEEGLQGPTVLGKQPLYQRWSWISDGH